MSRLTRYNDCGNVEIIGVNPGRLHRELTATELNLVSEALKKLAKYEDSDEREGVQS